MAEALHRIDLPAIVAAQVDLVAREVPAVGALPDDVIQGPFADALGRTTAQVLLALVEERPLTEDELQETAVAFSEVMTIWGLVIDDVIATFARGARLLWEAVERHAGPEQLRMFLGAGGGALDSAALIERIAAEAAADRPQQPGPPERLARKALAAAVSDRSPAPDPTSPRLFVALRPDADLRSQATLAQELRAVGVVAVTSDGHVVGSFPSGVADPDIGDDLLVVEALPRRGDPDVRRRRLHAILDLARALGRRGRLTDLDLAAERLLDAAPDVAWHLHEAIATVRSASFGAQLLTTATAFVAEDGDVVATARMLGLHRETVRYRLGKIEASTGLDLGGWRGRSILSLALRASSGERTSSRSPAPTADLGETHAATVPTTIGVILERLDRGALVRRLVEHRRAHRPALAAELAAVDGEETHAAADLGEVVALLSEERTPRDRALARVGRRTFAYLRLGATVEDIVAIGRSTPRVVWSAVLAATTDDELPQLRSVLGRLVLYIEGTQLAITQAAIPGRSGADEALLDALLDPDATEQRRIALVAEAGMTVDTRLRAFVIAPGPAAGAPARRVGMDLRTAGWAAIERGGYVVGVAPTNATVDRLDELVPPAAVYALGAPLPVGALGSAVGRLRRLVDLALADGRAGRVDLLDATIELLLISQPDVADAFREAIVAPLARRDATRGGQLADTLSQYVAHDQQRGATAAAMHLHPNSIDYRLRTIRQEIGRTFTSIEDVLAILLGVTADRLQAVR